MFLRTLTVPWTPVTVDVESAWVLGTETEILDTSPHSPVQTHILNAAWSLHPPCDRSLKL